MDCILAMREDVIFGHTRCLVTSGIIDEFHMYRGDQKTSLALGNFYSSYVYGEHQ